MNIQELFAYALKFWAITQCLVPLIIVCVLFAFVVWVNMKS